MFQFAFRIIISIFKLSFKKQKQDILAANYQLRSMDAYTSPFPFIDSHLSKDNKVQ